MQIRNTINQLLLAVMTCAAVLTCGANAGGSTNDPLTGLPLYPGVTDSNPLPKATVCKSQMQGDFYIVTGNRVDTVTDWYAKHLNGFKKYHAMTGSRSQDTFFNSDGTQEVTVTGTPDSTDVYSISYGRFQPGLPASQMPVFNTGKQVCK
jgi:hypothetical protein